MLISVVIPLYNKANTVKRAIDSVLKQSVLPLEIIVVNDGSIDGSELVVQQFDNSLIRLVHQENAGVSAARNKGIEEANGDWIALLDADDYWEERFLQTICALHIDFPEANVIASNYRYQNIRGEFSRTQLRNLPFGNKHFGILDNYFEVAATSSPPLWSSAIVVKKNSFIEINGFPLGITSGEDLLTWAKLAINNTIAYTTKPLSTFVLDPAHTYDDTPNRIPESIDFVGQQLKKLLKANPSVIGLRRFVAHWHKMRASIFLRLGSNRHLALIDILKSLKYDFFQMKVFIYLLFLLLSNRLTVLIFRKIKTA